MEEKTFEVGDGWRCHTPDPSKYHSVSSMGFSGGANTMLSSRYGIRGIVLPRASLMGGPRNKDVLKVGRVQIVDPESREAPISIDLSRLSNAKLESTIADFIDSSDDMTDLAYKTFKKLASDTLLLADEAIVEPTSLSNTEVHSAVSPLAIPTHRQKPKPVYPDIQSPLARFEGAKTVTKKQVDAEPNTITHAPKHRVTFELEGFGTIETSYHDVVQGDDDVSLVLIYDSNYQAGTKYFPPISDNDLYVDVHDLAYIFKVKSAGLHYKVGSSEHHIMLIEKLVSKEDGE